MAKVSKKPADKIITKVNLNKKEILIVQVDLLWIEVLQVRN